MLKTLGGRAYAATRRSSAVVGATSRGVTSLAACRASWTRWQTSQSLAIRSSTILAPRVASQSKSYATSASEASPKASLSRTPLFDLHLQHEAKIVPFAGYEMPLTYKKGGQLLEHAQVRERAGLFDVSHMVQHLIAGPSATQFVARLIPASLNSLIPSERQRGYFADALGEATGPFLSSLSLFLNESGGIIDDLIVTRQGEDSYYVVTNAGRRDEDLEHITRELKKFNEENGTNVKHEVMEDRGLVALQGPKAASVLQPLVPSNVDLSKLYFGQSIFTTIGPNNVKVHIARGGYTGEDGFEISIPGSDSIDVSNLLLGGPENVDPDTGKPLVTMVGLAARDSLRLEAGMCLYGHDLSEDVGPLEASLTWVVGEDRRAGADFIGAKPALDAMTTKAKTKRRVGLLIEPGGVAREGTPIYAISDEPALANEPVGVITSGIPSPTVKQNIAMAYVKFGHHKIGTDLKVKLRGKERGAKVARMPFVKNNYWREPKA